MRRGADRKNPPLHEGKLGFSLKQMILFSSAALLLVWGVFYLITSKLLMAESRRTATQLSGQIASTLQEEFLELERVSFSLSQNPAVKDFVTEPNAADYHKKSTAVKEYIQILTKPSSLVQNLIIYSGSDVYYRFRGELSSTAAAHTYHKLGMGTLPMHLTITLDGQPHIGYACGVYEGENMLGAVAILISQQKLQNVFLTSGASASVRVALTADAVVVAANDNTLLGLSVDEVKADAEVCAVRKVGATPFEVLVYTGDNYFRITRDMFSLAVLITAILFVMLIIIFLFLQNRHFFRPMLSVMQEVEHLQLSDETRGLSPTGEAAFDSLVEKINDMLTRLDESNRELRETQMAQQRSFLISLKKQINAHFTVNVLNVIKLLSQQGELDKVYRMCDGLSHLMRYAHDADEFIDGMEEFFILQKYIDIMCIRQQNNFSVDFNIDDRLETIKIPRMLIQPLLENAVVHGLRYRRKGGQLTVRAELREDCVWVEVSDNGCGISAGMLSELTQRLEDASAGRLRVEGIEHVALLNIARRISSYYGQGYGLRLESGETCGLRVTMTLGLQTQNIYEMR